jgi:hypothetical protein
MSKILKHKNLIFFLIPIILGIFVLIYLLLPIQSRLVLFGLSQDDAFVLEVNDLEYQFIIQDKEIDYILIENVEVLSYSVDFKYFDDDESIVYATVNSEDATFDCSIDIIEDVASCDVPMYNYELITELKETSNTLYIIFSEHFDWDKIPQRQR